MTTLLFSLVHGGIKIEAEVEVEFYPPESKIHSKAYESIYSHFKNCKTV